MVKVKKIWADPVWSKVIANGIWYTGAAVVPAVVTVVVVYFGGWWPSITAVSSKIISLVVASTTLPNWLFMLIGLLAANGTFCLLKILYRYVAPDWHAYRQDTFFGIVWHWDYTRSGIAPPFPSCPRCNTQMNSDRDPRRPMNPNRTIYHCGHCDNRIPIDDSPMNTLNKVIRQIERKLRQMGR